MSSGTPSQGNLAKALFRLSNGSYSAGEYVIKNEEPNSSPITSFTEEHIKELDDYANYYLPALDEIEKSTRGATEGGVGSSFYTITYIIEFANSYESSLNTVKIKF